MELEEREKMEKKRGRAPKSGTPKVNTFKIVVFGVYMKHTISKFPMSILYIPSITIGIFSFSRVKREKLTAHLMVVADRRRRPNKKSIFSFF